MYYTQPTYENQKTAMILAIITLHSTRELNRFASSKKKNMSTATAPPPAEETAASNEVSNIEDECLTDGSKKRYASSNLEFVNWLHKNQPDALRASLKRQLDHTDAYFPPKKWRKENRRVINEWFDKMDRNDPLSCPVHMEKMNYNIIANFMAQKKNKGKFYSRSVYEGIRSAFVHLYTMSNLTPPSNLSTKMSTLLKGFRRKIVKEKVEDGVSLEEGKEVMSFECLMLLCEIFFKGENDEYIFALTFLLLEWNLMARSDNIVNLHVNDLEWDDDALLIYMKKSKTDQEGKNGKVPFHVYFNTEVPFLNVGLALGLYLLTNPGILSKSTNKLFPAEFQYHRYSSILTKTIEVHADRFKVIGVKPGDIGSHSARKGGATLAATGCTVSPSMSSICTRAGWKLGGSRDKYIKFENAGDQFLGRTLCGLNSLHLEFASSPPFFDFTVDEMYEEVDKKIMEVLPDGQVIEERTFEVLRYCIASVCYHFDYLLTYLHDKHRFRAHPVCTNRRADLIAKTKRVLYCDSRSSPNCPRMTGIPPHITILSQLHSLKESVESSTEQLSEVIKDELNKRGVGGEVFQANGILDEVKEVHKRMVAVLGGSERGGGGGGGGGGGNQPNEQPPFGFVRHKYYYKGLYHSLPEGFVMPTMNLHTLIVYWFVGSTHPVVPPLKNLKGKDFPTVKSMGSRLSMMKKTISGVIRGAEKVRFDVGGENGRNIRTAGDATRLYTAVRHFFEFEEGSHERRYSQLNWKTIYDLFQKREYALVGEEPPPRRRRTPQNRVL